MAAFLYHGNEVGSTATITIPSDSTATTPILFVPLYCTSTVDFELQDMRERIRAHRRKQRAASVAGVHALRAMPAPRPVNHRISGRDIRQLIPRRI